MTHRWPLEQSWRSRVRVWLIRTGWWARKMAGRCRHEATVGPAGGDIGLCAICGADVDWTEDE